MSGLPPGWAWSTLGELSTEVRNGISAKPDQQAGVPILRISAVRPMRLDSGDVRYLPADFVDAEAYALRADDLLFTRYNGNRELVGACARVGKHAVGLMYPDKLIRVRLNTKVAVPGYIEKAVNAREARSYVGTKLKTSAGQVGVSGADLKALPIPLPPLAEQRRIADKLDAILARVDACRERLDRVEPLLQRFRQAAIDAACDGRLSETWRVQAGEASAKWRVAKFADLIDDMRNGLSAKPDEADRGNRILRISAVRSGVIDAGDFRRLTVNARTASQYAIRNGDLLFTRYNGSIDYVGVCAVADRDLDGYVYPDKLIRVRVKIGEVSPRFLALSCSTSDSRRRITARVKSSAGQKGISGTDLKTLPVNVPSLAEQVQIVSRVRSLLAFADRLADRLELARSSADRIAPALLVNAFRGQLVPQDPADEPASALLARLSAAAAPQPPARRRKSAA